MNSFQQKRALMEMKFHHIKIQRELPDFYKEDLVKEKKIKFIQYTENLIQITRQRILHNRRNFDDVRRDIRHAAFLIVQIVGLPPNERAYDTLNNIEKEAVKHYLDRSNSMTQLLVRLDDQYLEITKIYKDHLAERYEFEAKYPLLWQRHRSILFKVKKI